MSSDLKTLGEQLVSLTVKEVQELAEIIRKDYGMNLSIIINEAIRPPGDGDYVPYVERTEFDVVLKNPGVNRLSVMKVLRSELNKSLEQAKNLVDASPTIVAEGLPRFEAQYLMKILYAVGADVELR